MHYTRQGTRLGSGAAATAVPRTWAPGLSRRSTTYLFILLGALLASLFALAGTARAAVTIGSNVSAFPNRDMVVAVGYEVGQQLTIEVERNGTVIGRTAGPAVDTPEGVGLEVNHGPVGAPQPGDCWTNYTPDIIGGDVIRVTPAGSTTSDTMTVADVDFADGPNPFLDPDPNVSVNGVGTAPLADIAVEFRRDKPDPRFRRGPFPAVSTGAGTWKATFRPTATSAEGLSQTQQRDIALNEASWAAVVDNISETTLAELGEPGGVGPGCTGTAEPNNIAAGYTEPVNIASGDITLSGTAREGVAAVSIKVGALAAKDATLSTNATGVKTWTLNVTKAELATLPDGTITITPSFDGLAGASRTMLKDTVAPQPPLASPAAGSYGGTQNVTLTRALNESGLSRVYWEIGSPDLVPTPDEFSNPFTTQIAVSSTQEIKAIVIDAGGNKSTVASFIYRIGTPLPPPPGVTAAEGTTAGSARVSWQAVTGATGYNVYRVGGTTPVNASPVTGTSFTETNLANGSYSYVVRSLSSQGVESVNSASATATIAPPAVPQGLTATEGNAQVTLRWTAQTGVANFRVYRDDQALTQLVAGGATSFTDTGRTNGTLYTYAITALDASGNESAKTGIVQATPFVPAVAQPTVNPAAGVYTTAQSVTMSGAPTGGSIRYTTSTNGTPPADPTATSTAYSAPINVSQSTIIKAAAFNSSGQSSPVVQRDYVINIPPAAPTVTPATGTYTSAQSVTMTAAAGTTIRYTIGQGATVPADPTETDPAYTAPISVNQSQVIKAAAFNANGTRGAITQRNYTINLPQAGGGTRSVVAEADTMVKQAATSSTFGGTNPLLTDTQETTGNTSTAVHSYIRFNIPALAAGESITGASLRLNVTNPSVNGPAIFRTNTTWTEGTMNWGSGRPARSSTTAVGNFGNVAAAGAATTPISGITSAGLVSFQLAPEDADGFAFSSKEDATQGNRPQLVLTISSGGAQQPVSPEAPTASPGAGTYTGTQNVALSSATAGATIRYTVGTAAAPPPNPTATTGTVYGGPIAVSSSSQIKAVATNANGTSAVTTLNYTINPAGTAPAVPTANPAAGTYTGTQNVALSSTAGATIRYTVGTAAAPPPNPTATTGTVYGGPIAVSSSSQIKALATNASGTSAVTTLNYTINAAGGGTRTVNVPVTLDATVKQATPTTSYGTATALQMDTQETTGNASTRMKSYLMFNVPALAAGESIASGRLNLTVSNATVNGPAIHRISNTSWTETMTWNTAPATTTRVATVGNLGAVSTGAQQIPLTVAGLPSGNVAFELDPEDADGFEFGSRTHGTATSRPTLTLTINTP